MSTIRLRQDAPCGHTGRLLWRFAVRETLATLWFYWKRFGHRLGMAQTELILGLSYLLVFVPGGLALALKRADPLAKRIRGSAETYYQPKETSSKTLEEYKRQF